MTNSILAVYGAIGAGFLLALAVLTALLRGRESQEPRHAGMAPFHQDTAFQEDVSFRQEDPFQRQAPFPDRVAALEEPSETMAAPFEQQPAAPAAEEDHALEQELAGHKDAAAQLQQQMVVALAANSALHQTLREIASDMAGLSQKILAAVQSHDDAAGSLTAVESEAPHREAVADAPEAPADPEPLLLTDPLQA